MPKGHGRSSKSVVTSLRLSNDMNNVINYLCEEHECLQKNTMICDAIRMYGRYHQLLLHPIVGPLLCEQLGIKNLNKKLCLNVSALGDL